MQNSNSTLGRRRVRVNVQVQRSAKLLWRSCEDSWNRLATAISEVLMDTHLKAADGKIQRAALAECAAELFLYERASGIRLLGGRCLGVWCISGRFLYFSWPSASERFQICRGQVILRFVVS